jgi:O-antigen ligase
MNEAALRRYAVLSVVFCYVLLNYGFMQLRIPPSQGIGLPTGELLLVFSLATMRSHRVLSKLNSLLPVFPLLIWWAIGITRAFMGIPEYGMWSMRDATHVIESLFLIIGFNFASTSRNLDRFDQWLKWLLITAGVYGLLLPFSDSIQHWSPQVTSGAGQAVPLFFNFVNTFQLWLLGAVYLLASDVHGQVRRMVSMAVAVAAVFCTVVLAQSRTIYLQVIGIAVLLVLFKKSAFKKWCLSVAILLVLVFIVSSSGIEIKGRLGQPVSLEFLAKHFLAIGGVESDGLEGSAKGVPQRIAWWSEISRKLRESPANMMFGLGYGMPLTPFNTPGGVIVREPHNSYISIIARVGLVGLISWIAAQLLMIKTWLVAYRRCGILGLENERRRLLVLMTFFVLIWILAVGEDGFEKPFNAIPFYFFWGVTLRSALRIRAVWRNFERSKNLLAINTRLDDVTISGVQP